jgi:hypothetical protein
MTIALNSAICSQPLKLISEPFRPDKSVDEVHEQSGGHQTAEHIVEQHGRSPGATSRVARWLYSRSQRNT